MKHINKEISIDQFQFTQEVTMDDFEYVKMWMDNACKNGENNYNLNSHSIQDDFNNKNVFVLKYKGKVVAFLTFFPFVKIKVVFTMECVKPEFTGMGLARLLLSLAMAYFKNKGCIVAKMYNVQTATRHMGLSMGFHEMTEEESGNIVSMVKPLIIFREQNGDANVKFVIWEDYYNHKVPTYSWSMDFNNDKRPIIHEVSGDKYVGVVQNGNILIENVAKNFFDVFQVGYIYITEEKAKYIMEHVLS